MAMPQSADAKSLEFPGTAVKQLTAVGESWSDKIDFDASPDPGKGVKYADASDELGVVVLTAPPNKVLSEILGARNAVLSAAQIAELGTAGNPGIVRYCVERGQPTLAELAGRKLLTCEFVQEERIRVAQGGQAMCMQAFKIEAHAFTIDRAKQVHIYLIRSQVGDASFNQDAQLKSISTRFRALLSTIQWQ